MDTDSVLIEKASGGSIEAFSELAEAYQSKLFSFACKMTGSREDAEEIVQETLIRAYKNLWRYDRRASFSTWLYTIANNLCKTVLLKRKRAPVSIESMTPSEADFPAPSNDEPMEQALLEESRKEARKLMAFLKPDLQAALILKYMDDLPYRDIGRILKISEEAAKMKVYRAKKEILKRYHPTGGVF